MGQKPRLPDHPRGTEIRTQLKLLGVGLWTVYKHNDADDIFDMAEKIGAGHILPRFAGQSRTISNTQLLRLADRAHKKGMYVMPWIYAYPSTQQQWIDEAYELLGNHPAFAGVMLNIEHRRTTRDNERLSTTIEKWRKRHPQALVGYTGYNLAATHGYTGIKRLITLADFWSPQVYWSHNGSSPQEFIIRGYEQWYKLGEELGFDPVIVPVGQAYWSDRTIRRPIQRNSGEFLEFVQHTAGYPQISWYSYDDLDKPAYSWAVGEIASANLYREPVAQEKVRKSKKETETVRVAFYVMWALGLWFTGALIRVASRSRELAAWSLMWPAQCVAAAWRFIKKLRRTSRNS
jgi:hypothetical protein